MIAKTFTNLLKTNNIFIRGLTKNNITQKSKLSILIYKNQFLFSRKNENKNDRFSKIE